MIRMGTAIYNLDTYPGLVLSSDAHSIVYGEVYELKPELAARVLAILDDYEGCGASDPIPHEYRVLPVGVLDGIRKIIVELITGKWVASFPHVHPLSPRVAAHR
jgi:gamma-glutamylcyclotransferase (GGCT)/AIG2-like uncharacterized protein YtfP